MPVFTLIICCDVGSTSRVNETWISVSFVLRAMLADRILDSDIG